MTRADVLYGPAAAATSVLFTSAVILAPAATVKLALIVGGAAVVIMFLLRSGAAWMPLSLIAASALLPLLEVDPLATFTGATRPADNYVVAATGLVAAAFVVGRPRLENTTRLQVGFTLLALAAVLSAALGPAGASYEGAARFATYMAMVAVLTRMAQAHRERVLAGSVAVAVALAASIYAVRLQLMRLPSTFEDDTTASLRIGGLLGHPNFAAYFLCLCMLYVISRNTWRAAIYYPLIAVLGGAILITGARGALLALGVALVLMFIKWWRRVLVLGSLGYVLVKCFGIQVLDRFSALAGSGGIEGQNSAGWRIDQWHRVARLHEPFDLTGVGWLHAQDLLPGGLGAHNGYLEIWAELGLIGCGAFLILMLGIVKLAWSRGIAAVAMVAFVAVANVSDPVVLYPPVTYLLLALVMGLPKRHQDEPEPTNEPRTPSRVRSLAASPPPDPARASCSASTDLVVCTHANHSVGPTS